MREHVTHLAELLSAQEVAQLLRLDPYTIRRMAREGQLPGYKVGKSYRFDRQRVADWLETRALHPAAGAAGVQPADADEQLQAL